MGSCFLANLLRETRVGGTKSRGLKAVIVLILAFVVSFLVVREIFFSTLVFGDYPLVTPKSAPIIGEYVFQGWNRAAYGQNYPAPLAYLFLYLFSQLASLVGDVRVFNFMMNLSFPLSFIAFYFFSGKFCKSFWLRIFGSALYLINPAVLAYYNTGGFMWTFVFLPFALSFFIDFLEKHTNRNLAKAATFSGLTMWAFPSLAIALFVTFAVIALAYLLLAKTKKSFLRNVFPRLLVLILTLFLLNSSFLYAQYAYNQSPSYGFESESVLNDFQFAYQSMTIEKFLRLSGNVASPQATSALGYIDNFSPANAFGFLIPIIALAGIFWIRKLEEDKRAIAAMLLSIAFISDLVLFIEAAISIQGLNWILKDYSFLWTLRNPLKLQLMLSVCIIPFFIFSLERITVAASRFLRQKKRVIAGAAFVMIFLGVSQIYIYNSFAFNGYAGLDKTYAKSGDYELSYLPDETLQKIVNDYGNITVDDYGTYRGIILPFDHNTELNVQFADMLLYTNKLGQATPTLNRLIEALNSGANLKAVLSLLGTKYIYVNKDWKNSSFQIILPSYITNPDNVTILASNLAEDFPEENLGNYSEFTVDTALPHLYLSNYPIFFYNDSSTNGLLKSIPFSTKPVLIQVSDFRQQTNNSNNSSLSMVDSYEFSVPTQDIYYISVTTDVNESGILHYKLDKEENTTQLMTGEAQIPENLSSGNHTLSLFYLEINVPIFQSTSGETWIPDNLLYSSWSVTPNGTLGINTGKKTTLGEYDNFTLNLKFEPETFGSQVWQGPEIFFNWHNETSYDRLLFHSNGVVELATVNKTNSEQSFTIDWKNGSMISEKNWQNLTITKNESTLDVNLNDKHFVFDDGNITGNGRIAIGSDNSTSNFKDITLNGAQYESANISARTDSLWLLPAEKKSDTNFKILENGPTRYRLEFNQANGESPIIYLGENFNSGWEAEIDGKPLSEHFEANLFANCWLTNSTPGTHEVEIYFKYNETYQSLVYVSIVMMVVLAIAAYLPAKISNRVHLQLKTKRNKQQN